MKLKYMIVGFVAGVFATVALSAGASTVYEKFTAIARPDYTLVVDGEKVILNTPPKTIDGVTHLPLREAATILGKDVNFKSGTITLTTKESEGETVTETTKPEKSSYLDKSIWFNILNHREESIEKYGIQIVGDALGNTVISGNGIELTLNYKDFPNNGDHVIIVNNTEVKIKIFSGTKYFNIPDLIKAGLITPPSS